MDDAVSLVSTRVAGSHFEKVLYYTILVLAGGYFVLSVVLTIASASTQLTFVSTRPLDLAEDGHLLPTLVICFTDPFLNLTISEYELGSVCPRLSAQDDSKDWPGCVSATHPQSSHWAESIARRIQDENNAQSNLFNHSCVSYNDVDAAGQPSWNYRIRWQLLNEEPSGNNPYRWWNEDMAYPGLYLTPQTASEQGGMLWPKQIQVVETRNILTVKLQERVVHRGGLFDYFVAETTEMIYHVDLDSKPYSPLGITDPTGPQWSSFKSETNVRIDPDIETRTWRRKTAGELMADIGSAWAVALLLVSVCFVQKAVPGAKRNAPVEEVQVLRFRQATTKRELLEELASALIAQEEVGSAVTEMA